MSLLDDLIDADLPGDELEALLSDQSKDPCPSCGGPQQVWESLNPSCSKCGPVPAVPGCRCMQLRKGGWGRGGWHWIMQGGEARAYEECKAYQSAVEEQIKTDREREKEDML